MHVLTVMQIIRDPYKEIIHANVLQDFTMMAKTLYVNNAFLHVILVISLMEIVVLHV